MNTSDLYIIVPYFNFTNSEINRQQLDIFLSNTAKYPNTKLILVEGVFDGVEQLPDFSDVVHSQMRYIYPNKIWVKENLINLAISSLPADWEFVCWVDKDIEFLDKGWVEKTINCLKDKDIVQPWSKCMFLDGDGEPDIKAFDYFKGIGFTSGGISGGVSSFCRQYKHSTPGHPGQCWAMNRSAYNKVGKLMDTCIVGGGDGALSVALNGSYDNNLYVFYGSDINDYILNFTGVRVGYIEGIINHSYHGDVNNRQYLKRLDILTKNKFNPRTHIGYTNDGLIYLKNKDLENDILEYFYSRKEN
jgi:hypothetical protein